MRSAPLSPNSSMKTRPASSVPATAPSVFAEYSRPNASPIASDLVRWRTRAGNVAPIMIVAGASASTASTSRATASQGVPSSDG